jgi:peroxiredoxin
MMKKNIRWLLCFVIIHSAIFFITNNGYAQGNQEDKGAANDLLAADFTLRDIKGKNHRLSDYKGKVILLNFMASWCPECKTSAPSLNAMYSRHNQKGLIMLNIDIMESEEKAAAFSRKYNVPYPTLLDKEGTIGKIYGVVGVPVKVLIDRDGRIICWNCRSLEQLLEKQLEKNVK